ncbi:uncharacterized protein EI90DRAFT_2965418 [Cantharellus anzutake]|uniref:uncharacterized protein n=1 Tax=Cantharellus anzutake TaxID=1750568 RepID=UPI0019031DBE|nr:uncharacterized protein EI90DRAFT_2965418 [Cantharellus anzutake]KAF8342313.1 hypothetical protein EI90DRAFT_2965418 [Cantharellus anzutake]
MTSLSRSGVIASAARRNLSATTPRAGAARRASSEAHHGEHDSSSDHRTETLFTPFWRNTFVGGALAYGLVTVVPAPSESNKEGGAISKFIQRRIADPEDWLKKNEIHTLAAERTAHSRIVAQGAERPSIYRYKFPSMLEAHSPHLVPVGTEVHIPARS